MGYGSAYRAEKFGQTEGELPFLRVEGDMPNRLSLHLKINPSVSLAIEPL